MDLEQTRSEIAQLRDQIRRKQADLDLPLNFHPATVRVSAVFTPVGVCRATGDRRSWSGLRSRSPVAVKVAA
ncbi:hypothetical protein, partial [Rhodopseudomonas parapalustris]